MYNLLSLRVCFFIVYGFKISYSDVVWTKLSAFSTFLFLYEITFLLISRVAGIDYNATNHIMYWTQALFDFWHMDAFASYDACLFPPQCHDSLYFRIYLLFIVFCCLEFCPSQEWWLHWHAGALTESFLFCSATSNSILDKAIDSEDAQHNDLLRLVSVIWLYQLGNVEPAW